MKQLTFPTFEEMDKVAKNVRETSRQVAGYPDITVKLDDIIYMSFDPDFMFGVELELKVVLGHNELQIGSADFEEFTKEEYDKAVTVLQSQYESFVEKLI